MNTALPPPAEPRRRRFLKRAGIGAIGLAALAALERLLPPGEVPDTGSRRMALAPLSAGEFHTLDLFAVSVIGAPAGALDTRQAHTAERVELEATRNQAALLPDVQAALKVVEYLPLAWGFGHRFTRLDDAARQQVLQRMNDSDIDLVRSAFKGLRFLCLLCFYTDPRAWKRLGYRGPWVPEKFFEGGNRIVNLRPAPNAGSKA